MKILFVILSLFISLTGCSTETAKYDSSAQYFSLLEQLENAANFNNGSAYYDIEAEMSKTNEGYRYYIIIDNPKIAMYNIQAIATENNQDYSELMAANVGIFENIKYHMIPNQKNFDKGYVEGLSISGITDKSSISLNVLVKYQSKDLADTTRDYYHFELNCTE